MIFIREQERIIFKKICMQIWNLDFGKRYFEYISLQVYLWNMHK